MIIWNLSITRRRGGAMTSGEDDRRRRRRRAEHRAETQAQELLRRLDRGGVCLGVKVVG